MITKHGQIAHDLREQIADGTYPPGATLPAITDLMTTYAVARDTVRSAIALLTHEGLVSPRRGIGTIVRDTTRVSLSFEAGDPAPRTWAERTAGAGRDEVMLAEWAQADPEVAARLGIAPGAAVVHRVRRFSLGAGVVQTSEQWIPEPAAQAVQAGGFGDLAGEARPDGGSRNLFELFAAAGLPPAVITEVVGARMPDPEERDVMDIPAGIPVLVTERVTRTADGQAVEVTTATAAADRKTARFTVTVTY